MQGELFVLWFQLVLLSGILVSLWYAPLGIPRNLRLLVEGMCLLNIGIHIGLLVGVLI